jgi:hypothetical protein
VTDRGARGGGNELGQSKAWTVSTSQMLIVG